MISVGNALTFSHQLGRVLSLLIILELYGKGEPVWEPGGNLAGNVMVNCTLES
jgi:hypothetical protein